MNSAIPGMYCGGDRLESRPVEMRVEAGRFLVASAAVNLDFPVAAVRVSERLGQLPRFVYLPGEGVVEAADHATLNELTVATGAGRIARLIHWLELQASVAVAATVVLAATLGASVYFGLPAFARRAAYAVPDSINEQVGRAALASLDRFLGATRLNDIERRRVTRLAQRLVTSRPGTGPLKIEFRALGANYANAFALPGGIIIVSDELVRLATDDEELFAVLAHELGHIERRHGLQSIFGNSFALLIVSSITGDLSTLSSFAGSIPLTLLQRGYSRDFEREADEFALQVLRRAKIDPAYFASILEKLTAARPAQGKDFGYLSTHPSTGDRIKRINPDGHIPVASPAFLSRSMAAQSDRVSGIPGPLAKLGQDKTSYLAFSLGSAPPLPMDRPKPVYPESLRTKSIEGSVEVEFWVDRDGAVQDPVIRRSTNLEFEAPALEAVRRWTFTPAPAGASRAPVRVRQELQFQLEPNQPVVPPRGPASGSPGG